jgi:NRAMP (natural resistance-associated macrophage protein)-like metal ion transporter
VRVPRLSPPRLRRARSGRRGLLALFAILGPGLIAANAGNDAGGVATYASVGARYGYDLLWVMVLITISLICVQEMAARMGTVTGKGFAELVRERYGVRWATLVMVTITAANFGICISDFVGIGAALDLFGIPRELSVPIAAALILALLLRGSYRVAERVFVLMTIPFFAYPVAALLARPGPSAVTKGLLVPHVHVSTAYLLLLVATAGTTITPYMQLYLQSAVVDRGAGVDQLPLQRAEAASGAVFANLVACFIIIAAAGTLAVHGVHSISSASDAARALEPFAGRYAEDLFAIGLLGASLLAAAILPVTTAYVIAETFGFEKGLTHRPREAPVFAGIVTAFIVIAAAAALIPGIPVIGLLVGVQVLNGALLPVTLIFAWRLARSSAVLGPYRNGRGLDLVARITVFVTSALSIALLLVTVGRLFA